MPPSIRIRCPDCKARIKAPYQLVGQTRDCPRCGRQLLIQHEALDDCGPMLLQEDMPVLARVTDDVAVEEKLILIADDDQELNDGLRSVLENEGYRVIQAANGVQALEITLLDQPNLLILDMMMPRMGGLPVLEYFHNKPKAPPVIMITANESDQHKAYAQRLGVIDYLRKPFTIERLLESVAKGLSLN